MAVENKYVTSEWAAATKAYAQNLKAQGAQVVVMSTTFEVAAADDNGSIYRLFSNVPSNYVPLEIKVVNDAITGGSDWDLGVYKPELGDVVEVDILADGIDLSSSSTLIAPKNGMLSVDLANIGKKLWELVGSTILDKAPAYDIALTANTVGSGAGTVTVIATFANP